MSRSSAALLASPSLLASTALLASGMLLAAPSALVAQTACGDTATVRRSDTISALAKRCGVSEGLILRANPRIAGSDDLVVGGQIRVRTPASEGSIDRLGSAARNAGEALTGMARDLGSSVDDLLTKNPDLQTRLREMGERLGISGFERDKAEITATRQAGAAGNAVEIVASGLPAQQPVRIGIGAPGAAYEVVGQATTGRDGRLTTRIELPEAPAGSEPLQIVLSGPDGDWSLRSRPIAPGTRL